MIEIASIDEQVSGMDVCNISNEMAPKTADCVNGRNYPEELR